MSKLKSKAAETSKNLSNLLSQKKVQWSKVKVILQANPNPNTILDSLRRRALQRACLDPDFDTAANTFNVGQACLKLLLQQQRRSHSPLTHSQRVKYAILAARCDNLAALETIIYDDISVLFHTIPYISMHMDSMLDNDMENTTSSISDNSRRKDGGTTLLHRLCDSHGWNEQVRFVLKETLENAHDHEGDDPNGAHAGMFEGGYVHSKDYEAPIILALQAGADMTDVVHHLKCDYPHHFEKHLCRLPEIIAEYCLDMTLFCELIESYPYQSLLGSLHPNGSSPLHFACYYQNEGMIQCLLDAYRKREGKKRVLQKRLLRLDEQGVSPLSSLVLNVGDRDDGNAWRCLQLCVNFFVKPVQKFPFLHLVFTNMLDSLVQKPNCLKIIRQIVTRFRIDLYQLNARGKSVLSILISHIVASTTTASEDVKGLNMRILEYILSCPSPHRDADESTSSSIRSVMKNPAYVKDRSGRLPIHVACDQGMFWYEGLEQIVEANVLAIDVEDPATSLAPFALVANGTGKGDGQLDSIYRLLRQNPSVI